jgi:hypothetical protein
MTFIKTSITKENNKKKEYLDNILRARQNYLTYNK